MLFFDPLAVPTLLIMAAAPICSMPKATEISVVPVSAPIVYDYSKGLKEMQGTHTDTINPYDFRTEVRTQGLMSGSLKIEPQVHIGWQILPSEGTGCLWYDKVTISIQMAPTILLAREVFHDQCMKRAVMEHEMKHVNVDRQLVNKYSKIMGEHVNAALEERGFMAGPVPEGEMKAVMKRMQNIVFQVITHEFKKMELEQAEAQQSVDTVADYERVSRVCPDFRDTYTVRRAYGH
ncbi:MAG: hypothetical protein ACT4OY_08580 [Alphaproteobacteria bacterium]